MPAVNGVGKPCAGEPHARIDGRELETGHGSGHGGGEERPTGNRTVTAAPRLPPILVTAPAPDPPSDVFRRYVPPPVEGGEDTEAASWWARTLGVPTIADRVAQTVVARRLEAIPDGFDDSGGLVAEEEGKFVDPAFSIGQVSVTNAAGLDSHHNIARVGIGQNHSGEFNGSMGLARNDTTNGLRHRLLS